MVSAPISPEQFAAYLVGKGWEEIDPCGPFRQFVHKDHESGAYVPMRPSARDYVQRCVEEIVSVADLEKRQPHEVLRDIAAMVVP